MATRSILILLVLTTPSWAQSITYCQGCCTCIIPYSLTLEKGNRFDLFFTDTKNTRQFNSGFYGKGHYSIDLKILTLEFEDIPGPTIVVEKKSASDSLIVAFEIISNMDNQELIGTNVTIETNQKFSFVFGQRRVLKMPFTKQESLTLSFIGHEPIKYEFKEPGIIKLSAVMGPLIKYQFKKGERMKFKILKTLDGTNLRSIEGRKVRFTTRTCGC